ncbi:MAG: hypothetical protein KQH67_02540 [Bacteroidetes bacterium]|nr:hypothetical protein [Bacteroidota bacterium]
MESPSNPIKIGVTGHRYLDNEFDLKKQILRVLSVEIPKLFNNNSNFIDSSYLCILTPLAEGADRLVAESILEYNDRSYLEAVLPLPLQHYKKTFNNPDDYRFVNLLNKAKSVKLIRNESESISNIENFSETDFTINNNTFLNRAFEEAGRHIANHCDVLLALWDGKRSNLMGGTSAIVEYAFSISKPVIIISTKFPYKITISKANMK